MTTAPAARVATAEQVLDAFERIRRAQTDGRYAPHKPLLLLLALARLQHEQPRLTPLAEVEPGLKTLLQAFGPTGSASRRHLPYWHLGTDAQGSLWQVNGPATLLERPAGATPTLGELRQEGVTAGFTPQVHAALAADPALLRRVAQRLLHGCFPQTLHADIVAATGLQLESVPAAEEAAPAYGPAARRRRDPGFRERVLRAYEYRCCVCGFDLRVGHVPAGLEAAHIHWHHLGGPDVEPNGLALCALHHKLFDLGAFTVEPGELRVVFSQHAIAGDRGPGGALAHHGRPMLRPQEAAALPDPAFLDWNRRNVFKVPERSWR
ncbi:MAG: HNH endonuclease [Rubrivivax sp.]